MRPTVASLAPSVTLFTTGGGATCCMRREHAGQTEHSPSSSAMGAAPRSLFLSLVVVLLSAQSLALPTPPFCSSLPPSVLRTADPLQSGANITAADVENMQAFVAEIVPISQCSAAFSADWSLACDVLTSSSSTASSWFPLWTLAMQGLVDLHNVTCGATNLLTIGTKIVDIMNASAGNETVQARLESLWNNSLYYYINSTISSFVAADSAAASLNSIFSLLSNSSAPLSASLGACVALNSTEIPNLNRTLQELRANLSACTTQQCRLAIQLLIDRAQMQLAYASGRWSACAPFISAMQAYLRAAPLLLQVLQSHLFAYQTALADAHAAHGGLISFLNPFSASVVYALQSQVIASEIAAASPLIALFVSSSCAELWPPAE